MKLTAIANAVLASPANSRRLSDEEFSDSLQNELSARGFPGARIVISPESEPLNRSCSEDETVEVRVSRSVADVVVVGAHWFSRGEPGSSSSGSEKISPRIAWVTEAKGESHPAGQALRRQSNAPA